MTVSPTAKVAATGPADPNTQRSADPPEPVDCVVGLRGKSIERNAVSSRPPMAVGRCTHHQQVAPSQRDRISTGQVQPTTPCRVDLAANHPAVGPGHVDSGRPCVADAAVLDHNIAHL